MTLARNFCAAFFIGAGILHFTFPAFYERIVPPGFPSARAVVIVSGIAEIAGGVGLLVPRLRRPAGWGLLALLAAVYPANVYMAIHPEQFGKPDWIARGRLPFQFLFAWWVGKASSLGRDDRGVEPVGD